MCDDLPRYGQGLFSHPDVPFDSCKSCTQGKKYDRLYDALKHLATAHFLQGGEVPNFETTHYSGFSQLVVEVWVYEVDSKKEHTSAITGINSWYEHDLEDEEEEEEGDNLFYVEELA
jgi:hypothetical protein